MQAEEWDKHELFVCAAEFSWHSKKVKKQTIIVRLGEAKHAKDYVFDACRSVFITGLGVIDLNCYYVEPLV